MGQKINPHGFRVGVIKNWDSRWYARDEVFGDILVQDYKLRNFVKKTLFPAGVAKVEIERDNTRVRIFVHCAKPGIVIGRGGAEIDKLKAQVEKMTGKPAAINVVEIKSPDLNAQLVAESIAAQLEKRIAFRRAMKQAISRAMKLGAKGIKIQVGGRLGGAEIARTEHYHEGTIPLQTIRADIDYGFWEANTTFGKIGVKVWIYRGEVLHEVRRGVAREIAPVGQRRDRPPRRDDDRRPSGGGYGNSRPGGGYGGGNRSGGGYGGNRSGGYGNNSSGSTYNGPRRPAGQGYQGGNSNSNYNGPRSAPAQAAPAAPAAAPQQAAAPSEGGNK